MKKTNEAGDVIETLAEILKDIQTDKPLYMSDIVFLQAHQAEIKKHFPNEPELWQWADIPESEYLKAQGA